jgi:putative ABC transport system permease protein
MFRKAFWAIAVGGVLTLALVTQGVLQVEPWFAPRQLITLAGMIFANSMNTLSIAAERFLSETGKGLDYEPARNAAMRASLIPLTNTLLAVGIVSLPGMMTGQILAGESPLVAARYQIMVMSMVFGSGGISAAYFLAMLRPRGEEG